MVHVRDNVPGAVYIGRAVPRQRIVASPFGNPFPVRAERERQGAIERYRNWLWHGGGQLYLAMLPTLRGKPLACWCRHDGEETPACHGDVLQELLAAYTDEELIARYQAWRPSR